MTASNTTLTVRPTRAVPLSVLHSAWVLPVLILGEFAFVGIVPVALIAIGTIRKVKNRTVRWLAGITTAAYLAPFLLWALNPDRAESLSKDLNPVSGSLIMAASAALFVAAVSARKR